MPTQRWAIGAGAGSGRVIAGDAGAAVRPPHTGGACAGIDPAKIKGSESYASLPPMNPKAVWVADNYNHLHEQPDDLLRAVRLSASRGRGGRLNAGLAWAMSACG